MNDIPAWATECPAIDATMRMKLTIVGIRRRDARRLLDLSYADEARCFVELDAIAFEQDKARPDRSKLDPETASRLVDLSAPTSRR